MTRHLPLLFLATISACDDGHYCRGGVTQFGGFKDTSSADCPGATDVRIEKIDGQVYAICRCPGEASDAGAVTAEDGGTE